MSWEIIFVCALVVLTVASFVWEKLPVDVTAIAAFSILLIAYVVSGSDQLPSVSQLLQVFSNPAPLAIAAMFIISLALEKCGAIEMLAGGLEHLKSLPYPLFIAVMAVGVGGVSAFINNTPVVVVLMPVIISLARKMDTPASKLLIPLSYLSIFGGICTLTGTSTNLLMNGIIQEDGLPPLSMFELAWVGLPLLVIGTGFIMLFGNKLLPVRETLTAILSAEERKEYITEGYIRKGSDLAGQKLEDSALNRARGIRLLEVIRNGVALPGEIQKIILHEGDRLVFACKPSGIAQARQTEGIDFIGEQGKFFEPISANEGSIVEGVIGPMSSIVGMTISDINFRQRYRMVILAIHRKGRNVRDKLETLQLDFGDTILMLGTEQAIENLRKSDDLILLDRPSVPARDMRKHMPLVLGTLLALILAVTFKLLPVVAAAIIAVAFLFLTRTIKPKDAYAAVEWRILILIYGMLGLGTALGVSGATTLVSNHIVDLGNYFSPSVQPYVMLAILYLATNILTELLSNNATVVLMAPIAIGVAETLGIDTRPFIVAICVASSASFSTPIGYQTNTYVYGVGGYRFGDFYRIGIPLNCLFFIGSVLIIPQVWAFH